MAIRMRSVSIADTWMRKKNQTSSPERNIGVVCWNTRERQSSLPVGKGRFRGKEKKNTS